MRCHKAKSASGYMLSGVLQVNVLSCIFLRSVSLSTRVGSGFSCLVQEDTSQTDVGNSRALMPAPCSRAGHDCDRAWISTWLQRPLFFSSPPLLPSPAFPAILYPHATQSLPDGTTQIQSPRLLSEIGCEWRWQNRDGRDSSLQSGKRTFQHLAMG